jgi:hypothetical protein
MIPDISKPSLAIIAFLTAAAVAACRSGGPASPSPEPPPAETAARSTPAPPPATPSTAPAPEPTSTAGAGPSLPVGFPLDPALRTDMVVGTYGARQVLVGQGPPAREVSADLQASGDRERANGSGWDCRTHVEYEGAPAVDWYVQPGAAVRATMDGDVLIIINTVANAFEYYGVPRDPYLGDPDRSRAPLSPFPGPGGGMGVYASVINDRYRTDYGHLDLDRTIANVPDGAFAAGFSRGDDYRARFAVPQPVTSGSIVAQWRVRRGDVIGFTGDSGYSEAPHLHYQVTDRASGAKRCPTREPGFAAGGWLFAAP